MRPEQRTEGLIFVISAPSGAGKTSLCKEVVDFFPDLRHSVSHTTRAVRAGEQDGVDYHFVTGETFDNMVSSGEFAEWAEVHGNRYGTAKNTIEECLREGIDLLLDIDCQGASQLKRNLGRGVFIFILPPSFSELERRLRTRNTDAEEVIRRRVANAREEIRHSEWYDYIIVNDDFPGALDDLKSIIRAEHCRTERVLQSALGSMNLKNG